MKSVVVFSPFISYIARRNQYYHIFVVKYFCFLISVVHPVPLEFVPNNKSDHLLSAMVSVLSILCIFCAHCPRASQFLCPRGQSVYNIPLLLSKWSIPGWTRLKVLNRSSLHQLLYRILFTAAGRTNYRINYGSKGCYCKITVKSAVKPK